MTEFMTDFGTTVVNGVEYNEFPAPIRLFRLMKCEHAEMLVNHGIIRFGNLDTYREWENEILGDENDGIGMLTVDGHEYNTSTMNQIYALCTSMDSIFTERIRIIANSSSYNCILEIHNVNEFLARIKNELIRSH